MRHLGFQGYQMMVTILPLLRNPHYHQASDALTLDSDFLSLAAAFEVGIRAVNYPGCLILLFLATAS